MKFYFGETIGAKIGEVDNVLARIGNGWSKLTDLLPLLTSRCLIWGAKARFYYNVRVVL